MDPADPSSVGPGTQKRRSLASSLSSLSTTSEADSCSGLDAESVKSLARSFTESLAPPGGEPVLPFGTDNPMLDPNSPDFSALAWCRNLQALMSADPERFPERLLGVSFKDLSAYGYSSDVSSQPTVGNLPIQILQKLRSFVYHSKSDRVDILKPMDGILKPGETLLVLGRPGSGCSTFLRTLACQTYGFEVNKNALNYSGITPSEIKHRYRGDVTYCAESELHFPTITVGNTLLFAAHMKTPGNRLPGVSKNLYARHMRDVIMAMYGLSHTINTLVGNDLIRGISGGERKRVSIAELSLGGAALQCWDNSTRGLDSASAMEFCKCLRMSADIFHSTLAAAAYQASEEMYDLFDKVIVLYEGYQIYYGPTSKARKFFYDMGWQPKPRQATPDFLTSLAQPHEREPRKGFEKLVPRTAKEFNERWKQSDLYKELIGEIDEFNVTHVRGGEPAQKFHEGYGARKAKSLPRQIPYTASFGQQLKWLVIRGFWQMRGNPTMPCIQVFGNAIIAFIISSMFYNLEMTTGSFYNRSALLFFALLFNGFSAYLEIFAIYEAREIVQKHHQYAFYHPAVDALASICTQLPVKIANAIFFNIILYFLANLRREPGNFFFYLLQNFMATMHMSHLFRTIGAATNTIEQALVPSSIILLAMTMFTGFVQPTRNMHRWCRWINYIDPLAYAYEGLMTNEFHDYEYPCSEYIPRGPGYENIQGEERVCAIAGALPGRATVSGDAILEVNYRYRFSHQWRDFLVQVGFVFFFLGTYMFLTWLVPGKRTKGEVLVYPGRILRKKKRLARKRRKDIETGAVDAATVNSYEIDAKNDSNEEDKALIESSTDVFYWKDVCYDVKIKSETRRILNNVDGWVKPGTLTALMGASGAGKTTLLDCLANRVTSGVVTGHMFVCGNPRDENFQRSTGYVMQQDLHLDTATVRESLVFSAVLRQPSEIPLKQKIAYVENVIKILDMEEYADAVVGFQGEGLNVEQRKRLTIGVELAARPKLLLFLDEPTSGLDSQTAWSICRLMRKLSNAGQAILCTIHQPSALLLQQFDRLLFLAKGGRTVYFGSIGPNAETLINYFVDRGADPCPPDANPADWMLAVVGAAPGSHAKHDYAELWIHSEERKAVRAEIAYLMEKYGASETNRDKSVSHKEFAAPFWFQFITLLRRTLQQYYRTPKYIWSKIFLGIFNSIFNGFVFFKANNSIQGMQNLMYAVFMFTVVLTSVIQQLLPSFVKHRALYEARERPSKIVGWKVFIASIIVADLPWNTFVAALSYCCWYYPVGLYNNADFTHQRTHRGGLTFFYIWLFYLFSQTLGQAVGAGMDDDDTAANVAMLLFSLCLMFSGVLRTKDDMPGFWKFMYRVSPMTYWIGGMLALAIANSPVICDAAELITIQPPEGLNCGDYMHNYTTLFGGYVANPAATGDCGFCRLSNTNQYLASIFINYHQRWRNLCIFVAYVAFNCGATIVFYWLFRVPKSTTRVHNSKTDDLHYDPALGQPDPAPRHLEDTLPQTPKEEPAPGFEEANAEKRLSAHSSRASSVSELSVETFLSTPSQR